MPSEWGQINQTHGMVKLQHLLLKNNNITGTMPPSFTNLAQLTEFDISSNPINQKLIDLVRPLMQKEAQCLGECVASEHAHLHKHLT